MRSRYELKAVDALFKLAPVWAVLGALAIGALLVRAAGLNPLNVYASLINGAFGSQSALGTTLQKTIPLLFAGLGMAVAFRCDLVNLGGEGQIYLGALTAGALALSCPFLPALVMLPLCLIAAFVGGGVWGAIPGFLRAKYGRSEVITTILMNFVGFWFVSFLLHGPLQESRGYYPQSELIPQSARLPIIWQAANLHLGIVLALLAAVGVYVLLWRTTIGFEIRAVGSNPKGAAYSGVPVVRSMVVAMLLSGGLMGLAGLAEVFGVQYRISDFFSPGYGWDGIAVSLLGYTHPLGVTVAALFFAALRTGFNCVERTQGLPRAMAQTVQGITVLLLVISVMLPRLRRRLRRKERTSV
jgi:ABC-type uncharacterized transport system permease subunit